MAEIAFLIIAIALAAFLIALIPTLLRTRHVVQPLLSVRLLQNYLVKKTRKNKEVFS